MRAYNYLLFRLFSFYTEVLGRKDDPFLNVAIVSTILIVLNMLTVYGILRVNNTIPKIEVDFYYIGFIFFVLFLNYFLFIKNRAFLKYNFRKSLPGTIGVVLYIVFTLSIFLLVTMKNRELVFHEKENVESKAIEINK